MATIDDLEDLQDGISTSIQTLLRAYDQCADRWKARRSCSRQSSSRRRCHRSKPVCFINRRSSESDG